MSRKTKKKAKKIRKIAIRLIIIWTLAIFLYNIYINIEINTENYSANRIKSTIKEQNVEDATINQNETADILEETLKKVVGISKLKDIGNSILYKATESELGLGTGIIVTQDGYILSNEHVTGSKFSTCYVTMENGNYYEGTVLWSDSDLDLSIVKINAKDLEYAALGDSNSVRLGERVYAIGNPIGFEFRRTVTSGIISAKNRTIKIEEENKSSYMTNLIQTDATINPGNSGGPLITSNGEVIGINTVKITTAEGIGFAIPINIVKNIIESYKNTGTFEEAKLGIYAYDKEVIPYLNNSKNKSSISTILGISNEYNFNEGIYVIEIIKNSAADKSDLKEGDIITKIDDKDLNTMNDLREYIYTKKPNDTVILHIKRGKVSKDISIVLEK